tara:strand:+ start:5544 stop:6266 length:723 start_codon:yes stop_codon:yes gene_type:complete
MFITIEGAEGSGKTTMAKYLVEQLNNLGFDAIYTREPGGTEYAEQVRTSLFETKDLCPDAQLLALFSARLHHVKTHILPALEAGKVVVCDRFVDTTYAYQVKSEGASEYLFKALEDNLKGVVEPKLTLLFDAPFSEAKSRLGARKANNAYNLKFAKDEDRHWAIRGALLDRMTLDFDRIAYVDASKSMRRVKREVRKWARSIEKSLKRQEGEETIMSLLDVFSATNLKTVFAKQVRKSNV